MPIEIESLDGDVTIMLLRAGAGKVNLVAYIFERDDAVRAVPLGVFAARDLLIAAHTVALDAPAAPAPQAPSKPVSRWFGRRK